MNQNSQTSALANQWRGFLKSPVDWVLLFGLLGLLPLIFIEAQSLWNLKHYQFFPLAWGAFAAVLVLRGQLATSQHRFRLTLGTVALVFTLLFAVLAVVLIYPKLAQVAAIGLLFGWMLVRLGKTPWYECFAWILLLLITVRLPVSMDQQLIHNLQAASSTSASHLLDLTGIPHLATGNVIEIKPGKLFVEEACSGVDSFYALGAVALMLAIWQRRGFIVNLLTIAAVPLWAWFGNVVRLYVLTYLYNNWGWNLTEGWQHTVLGLVIFSLAFGGLLTMQETLTRLLWPLPGSDSTSEWAPRLYNWIVTWPHANEIRTDSSGDNKLQASDTTSSESKPGAIAWVLSGIAILAFLGCFVASGGQALGLWAGKPVVRANFDRGDVDVTFSQNDLPANLSGMQQRNFEISHRERNSMFGAHSATWGYLDGDREVVLSLDFAFPVFHPLEVCYISIGSEAREITQTEIRPSSDPAEQPLFISSVNLKDVFGQESYLVYTEFNEKGVSAERIEVMSWTTFFNKGFLQDSIGPLYQLQLLVSDAEKMTDEQKERYQQIVREAQKVLLPKIQQLTSLE